MTGVDRLISNYAYHNQGEKAIISRVKPTILKLGGSVITMKEKPFTPNMEVIRRLAQEIREANVSHLILIHGGGSYGHPLAEKYNLTAGYAEPSQLIGFAKTHEAMASLNKLLVEELINSGIPALGMPPSSFMLMEKDEVHLLEWRALMKAIQIGLTPVLYGDVTFDEKKGFNILSGDRIAALLAVRLAAKRIIMATDVDGLYTSDPKIDASAQLVRYLKLEDIERIQVRMEKPRATDVTGGMSRKVLELADPIGRGVEAIIVNGTKPNRVYQALTGGEFVGTRIAKT